MTKKSIAKTKKSAPKKKPANHCKFAFSDSRNCAMPRWNRHKKYCLFHARQEQQLIDTDQIGGELAAFTGEFRTNTDLNHALGNLFQAVAKNRIPPRSAAVLAYIGQLLQHSIPSVQREITRIDGEAGLEKVLRRALDAHDGAVGGDEDEEDEEGAAATTDTQIEGAPPESSRRRYRLNRDLVPHIVGYTFHRDGHGGMYVPIEKKPPATAESSPSNSGANRQ